MVMPFGKYEGKDLTEIPKRYLLWLRTQKWVAAWLVQAVNEALGQDVAKPVKKPWMPSEGEPWGKADE
jgi:uncharacterized protein (DUF3820 family)